MNILTNSTTVNVTNVDINNEVELYAILDENGFGGSGNFLSYCVFELTYDSNDFDLARLIGELIIAGFEVNKV